MSGTSSHSFTPLPRPRPFNNRTQAQNVIETTLEAYDWLNHVRPLGSCY